MNSGRPVHTEIEPSLTLSEGWHCGHFYYRFNRAALGQLTSDQRSAGAKELIAILDPAASESTERLQLSVVSGHRADFSLMLMDPCPLEIDKVHQRLLASTLGVAIEPTYSFVSVTEISEYVPTIEQYSDKLIREGETAESATFNAKVKAYEARLPAMNRQRLTPEFPAWPATCFYPMNKIRHPNANWFSLSKSARQELMSEHARSGMQFMGRVSQLITVAVGLDDWEWGVTLWAKNPEYLKDIVYKMRFDKASTKYAEFGEFFVSYMMSAPEMLQHCNIVS